LRKRELNIFNFSACIHEPDFYAIALHLLAIYSCYGWWTHGIAAGDGTAVDTALAQGIAQIQSINGSSLLLVLVKTYMLVLYFQQVQYGSAAVY
jgi:hypothetical protein